MRQSRHEKRILEAISVTEAQTVKCQEEIKDLQDRLAELSNRAEILKRLLEGDDENPREESAYE